jgi:protocatechuate 3,4-dioxygenase beta subunit
MFSLPRRTLTIATLLLLLLAASAELPAGLSHSLALAQTTSREGGSARTPTGSITGRVTSDGEGVAGVLVELLSSQSGYRPQRLPAVARATTDEEGRFRLANIAAGRYYIRAFAPNFVITSDNPARAMARTVILDEGDAIEGVNFTMTRGSVITGRVTDGEGRPVIGEVVHLSRVDDDNQQVPSYYYFSNDRFTTDDRGIYRIYGLPAGYYRVSVGTSKGENDGRAISSGRRPFVRTYHPNATESREAKIVELSAGTEATGINITVGSLSETFKADGRIVEGESGQPLPGLRFSYGNTDSERSHIMAFGPGDRSNQKGEFHIENLSPGRYAAFLIPDGESEWYAEPTVFEIADADVSGIEIKVRRGASMSGVAVIEGTADRSLYEKLRRLQLFINMERQGLQIPTRAAPRISADGSFYQSGLPPGRARIDLWPPGYEGLSLLRIERDGVAQHNGIEVGAGEQVTGVRLVLIYGTGVVRGRVVTQGGAIPTGMRMAVSVQRADAQDVERRYGGFEVDERGRFLIDGLASGEYEMTLHVYPAGMPADGRPVPVRRPIRPVTQRVSVSNGTQTEITFTLNMDAEEAGGEG